MGVFSTCCAASQNLPPLRCARLTCQLAVGSRLPPDFCYVLLCFVGGGRPGKLHFPTQNKSSNGCFVLLPLAHSFYKSHECQGSTTTPAYDTNLCHTTPAFIAAFQGESSDLNSYVDALFFIFFSLFCVSYDSIQCSTCVII